MTSALPAWLSAAIAQRLEGVSRQQLAAASSAITEAYRAGARSKAHVVDELSILAYLAARMPATYAAVVAALERLVEHAPEFSPQSLLDIGAGPGTATFAALDMFPSISSARMRDHNRSFLTIARALAAASPHAALSDVDIEEGDAAGDFAAADLVIAAYMMVEMPEAALAGLIERLWVAAKGALLLVEPGTPEGFRRLRVAREKLMASGAHILAPCTHALACPMVGEDWCHFSVRLPRSRDHRLIKQADAPFEDERFAYLAVSRQPATVTATARVLASPQEAKPGITFKLCEDGAVKQHFVASRDIPAFRVARRLNWGDTF